MFDIFGIRRRMQEERDRCKCDDEPHSLAHALRIAECQIKHGRIDLSNEKPTNQFWNGVMWVPSITGFSDCGSAGDGGA